MPLLVEPVTVFHTIWNYIVLYAASFWYYLKEVFSIHRRAEVGSQNGKIGIVTGGGSGIGLETVKRLLKLNMTVYIAGRMADNHSEVMDELHTIGSGTVEWLECDLASIDSVIHCARKFESFSQPLHLLVNNAGIMFAPETTTADGYESHFQVNYLAHFLLAYLLLPLLISSGTSHDPARIVNVTSCLYKIGSVKFDDINRRKHYSCHAAYAQSKLAQVLFTLKLSRLLEEENRPVIVNCVHPGIVFSALYKHVAWARHFPWLGLTFLKNPAEGSDTVTQLATSPNEICGGYYYENCSRKMPAAAALNVADQERLWRLCCSQLGIEEFGIQ